MNSNSANGDLVYVFVMACIACFAAIIVVPIVWFVYQTNVDTVKECFSILVILSFLFFIVWVVAIYSCGCSYTIFMPFITTGIYLFFIPILNYWSDESFPFKTGNESTWYANGWVEWVTAIAIFVLSFVLPRLFKLHLTED